MLSLHQRTEASFGKSSNEQSSHLLAWAGLFQKNRVMLIKQWTQSRVHTDKRGFGSVPGLSVGMSRCELEMACAELEGNVSNW